MPIRVFKIYSPAHTQSVFIGSTISTMKLETLLKNYIRIAKNKNAPMPSTIWRNNNIHNIAVCPDVKIELLKSFTDEDKAIEYKAKMINEMRFVINKKHPLQTPEEYRETYDPQPARDRYYNTHQNEIRERNKLWARAHSESLKEYKIEHYNQNKEAYKARARSYYQANKDAINTQRKLKREALKKKD